MTKIFVCYRRDESLHVAGRLYDRLTSEFGITNVFMDLEAIPLGANFAKVLRQEVAKCDVLLALIGERWLELKDERGSRRIDDSMDFVRIEIAAALTREIPVIPLLIDDARMPKPKELPEEIQELPLRQGIRIRGTSFRSDADKLIAGIKSTAELIKNAILSGTTKIQDAHDSFATRLETAAAVVERRLREVLSKKSLPAVPKRLLEAMRYASLGGSKRFRSFLLMETAALFGMGSSECLDVAAALECVHCCSLAHDDLPGIDDDDLRRGKPTLHKLFDEATAILAGDALLTLAFEILLRPAFQVDHLTRIELALGLARSAGPQGLVGGQIFDLSFGGRFNYGELQKVKEREIITMEKMKTGSLITFACSAGGIIGHASPSQMQALERYGSAIGSAFQIADGLLDFSAGAAIPGETGESNAEFNRTSTVGILGPNEARKRLRALVSEAEGALVPFGAAAAVLIEAANFISAR